MFTYFNRLPLAFVLSLFVVTHSPVIAQDVGDGEIVTEQLEPLAGTGSEDEAIRDDRFKQAPFTTPGPAGRSVLIDPVETSPRVGAKLRLLDKMTGQTRTFKIETGNETVIERLMVKLDACRSPEGNAQFGTIAFVQIWDTKQPDDPPIFSGWMLAESPALSALDHPRYDVWVISCTTSEGEAPVANE